jgi:hypothetical protein
MNQETLNLEEYRCRKCGRLFCIDAAERHPLAVDFGCPYGCDDNGERIRGITAGIERAAAERDDATRIRDHQIVIELCEGDFESSMKRKPRGQEEFDEWAHLAEKGLLNGHIDWDIIYECTREAMPGNEDE